MDLAKLVVKLEAQTAQYMQQLNAANRKLEQFQRNQSQMLGKISSGFKNALGMVAAGFSIRAIVQNTSQAEHAFSILKSAVETTGGSAGRTAERLAQMAEELSGISTFGGEEIMNAQQLLMRFQSISGVRFDRAIKSSMDLASALNTDLSGAAKLVGKALEEPAKGLRQLANSGVTFTSEQEKLVKSLLETGQKAKAQELILNALDSKYKGSAEAARNTFGGAIKALNSAFGDLLKGKDGFPGLTSAINSLTDTLNSPEVKEGFQVIITSLARMVELAVKVGVEIPKLTRQIAEGAARAIHGSLPLEMQNLDEIQRKINGLEQTRQRMISGQMRSAPNSIKNIDAKIADLRVYEAQLLAHEERIAASRAASATSGGIDTSKPLAALEEVSGAGTRTVVSAWEKLYEQWDSDTQTAVEKQIEYLNEFESKLIELAAAGRIGPEEYQARWEEALDSVLQEIEPAGQLLGDSLMKEFNKVSKYMEEAMRNTHNIIASFLEGAFSGQFDRIDKMFLQMINSMAANAIAAQLAQKLFGTPNGSGGMSGGWLDMGMNFVSGLFRDTGGIAYPGRPHLIGTGAQPELFVPRTAGEFYPADEWMGKAGGGQVVQNINFSGRVDQRSARQLALETSRQQQIAAARYGG